MVTSRLPALVAAGLLVLVGCGEKAGTASRAQEPGRSAEPRVSCGADEPGWPVSAMAGGVDSQADPGEITSALEEIVVAAPMDAPRALREGGVETADWFVLAESGDALVVATSPWTAEGPEEGGSVVSLERDGQGWGSTGWTGCSTLRPVQPPGWTWVEITPARGGPDRSSTTIDVRVSEVECTSGRDPRAFLGEPRVDEADDSVTVYWASRPVEGVADCRGNPYVGQQLELAAPLGDRALLDGSTWPPTPVYPGSGR